jgi:hypothetical protein
MKLRVTTAEKARLELATQLRPGLTITDVIRMACRWGNKAVVDAEQPETTTPATCVLTVIIPDHERAGRTPDRIRATLARYLDQYTLTPPDPFRTDLVAGRDYIIASQEE